MVQNSLHFIQTANDVNFCPVFPGDTRVTMIRVEELETIIAKRDLMQKLREEAADFTTEVMQLEIPRSPDRLRIPIVVTSEKLSMEETNMDELVRFLDEKLFHVKGEMTSVGDFYNAFVNYLDPEQVKYWTKRRVTRDMATWSNKWPKARLHRSNQFYFGNISFEAGEDGIELTMIGDYLE